MIEENMKLPNAYHKETDYGGLKTKFNFYLKKNEHDASQFFEVMKDKQRMYD
jgi:hypothetical protein